MSSTIILHKLSKVIFPAVKLTKDNAKALAAALREHAATLDNYSDDGTSEVCTRPLKKAKRAFDFSRSQTRYVALRLLYVGWTYHGYASQDHEANTIEGHLFRALRKTCLIPETATWEEVRYSRCGRTDIGVSAAGQTVALMVRSAAKRDEASLPGVAAELDYPYLINRVLPDEIQVTGWAPVEDDFHARFSATFREYKYFIADAHTYDLPAMQVAAKAFEGGHDFSNFCRMNLDNSLHHLRNIEHAEVSSWDDQPDMLVFTVRGKAFIWHQVRCMAAVLMMVGKGLEEPSIVSALLDVEKNPGKPQYQMASEVPLLLNRTGFDRSVPFTNSSASASAVLHRIGSMRAWHAEKLALLSTVLAHVQRACAHHSDLRLKSTHIPLMRRGTDPTYAARLLAFQHKKGMPSGSMSEAP